MSTIAPVVRHMLLCREVRRAPNPPHSIDLLGVVVSTRVEASGSYPLQLPDLTVFVQFTGGRGEGTTRILLREADTDVLVYDGPGRTFTALPDPLTVRMATFRIHNCTIPHPGLYLVQLCYNDEVIAEEPFTAR